VNHISSYPHVIERISDKRRLVEILIVFVTAIGKFIFMDFLEWRFPFIISVILVWTVYLMYRKKEIKDIFKYWGLSLDNFKFATLKVLPFTAISVIMCFSIGYYQDTINITWHIIPILILYPIWGTIQQLLIIGLIAGNLKDLKNTKINKFTIIIITAILFAVVHYPHYWLVLGTFSLALFYGYVYLKVKNLFVLGILHGWLGALFFYTVLNRDPFEEVFVKFFN
jgi:uncharacterized protein